VLAVVGIGRERRRAHERRDGHGLDGRAGRQAVVDDVVGARPLQDVERAHGRGEIHGWIVGGGTDDRRHAEQRRREGIAAEHVIGRAAQHGDAEAVGLVTQQIVFEQGRRREHDGQFALVGEPLDDVRQQRPAGNRRERLAGETRRAHAGLNDDGGAGTHATSSTQVG
jgi:hypothetical protein